MAVVRRVCSIARRTFARSVVMSPGMLDLIQCVFFWFCFEVLFFFSFFLDGIHGRG